MKKNILVILTLVFLLSGCVPGNENLVGPDTGGIWQALIKFFSQIIIFFSQVFDNNLVFGVIALAVVFNIFLIPLTAKQQSFSNKLEKIKPQLDRITKKYEKLPKTEENQMKQSQEMMALYTKYKINPFMGCLPMLVQMPLLIAVYGGVTNLILFTQTGPDGQLINGLALFGVEYLKTSLFGFDLAQVANFSSGLILLPLLSGLLSYLSVKITNIGMDSAENPSMKMMMIMSPLLSIMVGFTLPGVISVYWIASTVARTIITLFFKRQSIKLYFDRKKINSKN